MTSSAPFRRFAFAFGITFAVLYVVALAKDLALFTVFPSLGIVLAGTQHSRDFTDPAMGFLAPAMYWYGWAATAALGALIVALVAASFAERLARYVWPGWVWPGWVWVIPVLSMIACVYLTLPWFRL
jgi:amino acid permease